MKMRAAATVATAAAASAISIAVSPFVVFVSRCSQSDDEDQSGSDGGDCGSGKRDQHSGFSFRFFRGSLVPVDMHTIPYFREDLYELLKLTGFL